jgi:hypothetical protein
MPASSILTMPATRPYTPTVISRPMPETTATWVAKGAGHGAQRDDDDLGR